MTQFDTATVATLLDPAGHACACGMRHTTSLRTLHIGAGAIRLLPETLAQLGARRPFIVCDDNTYQAAGAQVQAMLDEAGIPYLLHMLQGRDGMRVEPDEAAVGSLMMAFDPACDLVLAVGSGVINDCAKVLAHVSGRPVACVATAPSMDGYASSSSSMIRRGVKVSLYSASPTAILADTDILKNAPMQMLHAGYGDMVAKYVSLCEWRMSHLVTGEAYCANTAALVRRSLAACAASADGLAARDAKAVESVMEGLVLSGVAMDYVGNSRPASGLEHYFSHVWEMQALQRGQASELHGLQVGVGTLLTLGIHAQLRSYQPDRATADAAFAKFSNDAWEAQVRAIFGETAQELIDAEHTSHHKNSAEKHEARLSALLAHWPEIERIIAEELPPAGSLEAQFARIGMPMTPASIGITPADVQAAYFGSRDIRDKYITSSMLFDLGIMDTFQYQPDKGFVRTTA